MTRPAAGGDFVLEGAEADADVDAAFDGSLDGLRVHVVCSVVASVGSGGASLRDAIRRPASGQPFLPSGRDARAALIAIGSCDGARRVDVIGAKDVRSRFVGIAAMVRGRRSRRC